MAMGIARLSFVRHRRAFSNEDAAEAGLGIA
jgi:hypothetical protein